MSCKFLAKVRIKIHFVIIKEKVIEDSSNDVLIYCCIDVLMY